MLLQFQAQIQVIQSHSVMLLPKEISQLLPSRGMLMAHVSFLNFEFITPLEPDGYQSHWFELDASHLSKLQLTPNQTLVLELELIDNWPEPDIPDDFMEALFHHALLESWNHLTVKAKWDWIRWIRFTKNPDTRRKRIQIACSKLQKGDKRPCCFDRTRCTITDVSKSGILISPS